MIYGDNAKDHPRWSNDPPERRRLCGVAQGRAAAASTWSICPTPALKGNSHMVMMDKNSGQVADLIQKWLVSKGLSD